MAENQNDIAEQAESVNPFFEASGRLILQEELVIDVILLMSRKMKPAKGEAVRKEMANNSKFHIAALTATANTATLLMFAKTLEDEKDFDLALELLSAIDFSNGNLFSLVKTLIRSEVEGRHERGAPSTLYSLMDVDLVSARIDRALAHVETRVGLKPFAAPRPRPTREVPVEEVERGPIFDIEEFGD